MKLKGKQAAQPTEVSIATSLQPSAFFKLPPELRERCYEYVLFQEGLNGQIRLCKYDEKLGRLRRTQDALAVLLTCRQAFAEAAGLFYAINDLSIRYSDLKDFVTQVTNPRRLAGLRKLDVIFWERRRLDWSNLENIFPSLLVLPQLRSLRFVFRVEAYTSGNDKYYLEVHGYDLRISALRLPRLEKFKLDFDFQNSEYSSLGFLDREEKLAPFMELRHEIEMELRGLLIKSEYANAACPMEIATPSKTGLFDLPMGIRESIYGFVLKVRPYPDGTVRLQRRGVTGLALLATCRKVYNEAVELFYSLNKFSVSFFPQAFKDTLPLLDRIRDPRRLAGIRDLTVELTGPFAIKKLAPLLRSLRTLPNLKSLRLEANAGGEIASVKPELSAAKKSILAAVRPMKSIEHFEFAFKVRLRRKGYIDRALGEKIRRKDDRDREKFAKFINGFEGEIRQSLATAKRRKKVRFNFTCRSNETQLTRGVAEEHANDCWTAGQLNQPVVSQDGHVVQ